MKQGLSATDACEKAVEPIRKYFPNASGALICLKADGTFGGAKLNFQSFLLGFMTKLFIAKYIVFLEKI